MTNSMSRSTHHLWHSLHITSPQFVDKVCILFTLVFVIMLLVCFVNIVVQALSLKTELFYVNGFYFALHGQHNC